MIAVANFSHGQVVFPWQNAISSGKMRFFQGKQTFRLSFKALLNKTEKQKQVL